MRGSVVYAFTDDCEAWHSISVGVWKTRLGVEVRMMSIDDLLDADEVFLTNSSWKVLPVVKVEAEVIGSGAPGMVTGEIRAGVLG